MTPTEFLLKVWAVNAHQGDYVCLASKEGGRWREHVFPYGSSLRSKLEEFFHEHAGDRDLYFCPNAFSEARRSLPALRSGRWLYADLDEVDPKQCDPRPTVAIKSSPGRYVGLWKLDKPLPPKQLTETNRHLTYRVGADKGGWDGTQVLRIPGTKNFKYEENPTVRLLWFEAGTIAPPDQSPSANRIYEKWKAKIPAHIKVKIKAKHVIVGQRSSMLWAMENELIKIGMKPKEVIELLKNTAWNKYKGRRDEDERFSAEIMKIAENQYDEAEEADEKLEGRVEKFSQSIVRMDEVKAVNVEWVWYPYIPRGKLTLIEGDPSMGKSWITFALASFLSRGRRLPNQDRSVSGRVLLMSAEDGLDDTVRPRLDMLDADVRRVYAYTHPISLDEDGLKEFESQVIELRPLVVIMDPLVAYMTGAIDLHRANEVREFTAKLGDIAERYNVAIIGVRHLTKGARDKAIYRGIGSIDLSAAARSVMHVGQDPEDESVRVIVHIKSNLAPQGSSIRYRLERDQSPPFKWAGVTKLKAHDLVQNDKDLKTQEQSIAQAERFLKSELKAKPRSARDLKRDGEAKGISVAMLKRARDNLNVQAVRIEGIWHWQMEKNHGKGK